MDVTSLEIDANRWGYSNGHIVFNAQVLENATGESIVDLLANLVLLHLNYLCTSCLACKSCVI